MSKNVLIVVIVILVAAVAGLLGWYFTKEESISNTNHSNTTVNLNLQVSRPPENTVWIKDGSFTPSEITVSAGDTVTWVNKDDYARGVASDPDPTHSILPALVSDKIEKDQTYTFTFTEEGEWGYHNFLDPVKHGKVIVE
ncbi:MAG: cupredoxin domain-containing protein [Patescibacteria group bacterium]|nr:cupredoxin domain-containing protein [Patescibacteria group bacterium]